MSTPINVIINDTSVIDDLESVSINQQEGGYCLSCSLSLKSDRYWALCDPAVDFGVLRIKVVIGGTTYSFLAEERDTSPTIAGMGFTVWGRSKQALLSKPYSKTILDSEAQVYPWNQGRRTKASIIVAYAVDNFCSYGVTVSWNVIDFIVYGDSFSVSNQSPIDVIASLAGTIGAQLVAHADGSLSVETYSVDAGTAVAAYNDMDDIVSLSESIDYPSGYNAVTVYGYVTPSGGGANAGANASISAEHIKTNPSLGNIHFTDGPLKRVNGVSGCANTMGGYTYQSVGQPNWSSNDPAIYTGDEHRVRVYFYDPRGNIPTYYFPDGTCLPAGISTEEITEDVTLTFGKGNTSMSNVDGETEVTGEGIPLALVSHTYVVNYVDYMVRPSNYSGTPYLRSSTSTRNSYDFKILFYFEDNSAMTVYSFTVIPREEKNNDNDEGDARADSTYCSSMVLEKVSPAAVVPGSEIIVRLYGHVAPTNAFSGASQPKKSGGGNAETQTEDIVFTDGVATLTYPISGDVTVTFYFKTSTKPTYRLGSNILTVNSFKDNAEYMSIPAHVAYNTDFQDYKVAIPSTWVSTIFPIWFSFSTCDTKTLELDVTVAGGELFRDITINVKDYATEVAVESAMIYIDGAYAGTSDVDGNLTIDNIVIGDHTIKLTKAGYLDSDLDDLANDTFTVTA